MVLLSDDRLMCDIGGDTQSRSRTARYADGCPRRLSHTAEPRQPITSNFSKTAIVLDGLSPFRPFQFTGACYHDIHSRHSLQNHLFTLFFIRICCPTASALFHDTRHHSLLQLE